MAYENLPHNTWKNSIWFLPDFLTAKCQPCEEKHRLNAAFRNTSNFLHGRIGSSCIFGSTYTSEMFRTVCVPCELSVLYNADLCLPAISFIFLPVHCWVFSTSLLCVSLKLLLRWSWAYLDNFFLQKYALGKSKQNVYLFPPRMFHIILLYLETQSAIMTQWWTLKRSSQKKSRTVRAYVHNVVH